MTIQEARKQINEAENRVNNAFSDMKNSAYSLAGMTESAAHAYTKKKTLIPLIACILGVFFCLASSWGWGIFLIIAGVGISGYSNSNAKVQENQISNLAKNLYNQLDQYSSI